MNKKELLELIKTGEGYKLEFKANVNKSLSKEICAFANASGGTIILGVNDNGSFSEIKISNSLVSQIEDISYNIDPSIYIDIERIGNVLIIHIPEGLHKPYFSGGYCFLRHGSNSQKLSRDEIRHFFQRENVLNFENKTNQLFSMNRDFNKQAFYRFCEKAHIEKSLKETHIMHNLGLLSDDRINNAGILFFAHNIADFFLNSVISCVLYANNRNVDIIDRADFSNDFIYNFENTVIFIQKHIRNTQIIDGIERQDLPEIQDSVIREIIINAMVHRDYFSEGRIIVEIYSDRIEISNPGSLLFNQRQFGRISLARNPLLADLSYRIKYAEKIGSGIKRIQSLMGKRVKFDINSDWFRVILIRKSSQKAVEKQSKSSRKMKKTQRKQLILNRIAKGNFTKREFAAEIGMNVSTIEKDLKELKKEKKIQYEGSPRGGEWKIIG